VNRPAKTAAMRQFRHRFGPRPLAVLEFLLNKISSLKRRLSLAWHSHSKSRIAVMGVAKRTSQAAFKGSFRDA
jgi:hypothetical protein